MELGEKAKQRLALGLKYFFEEPRNVAAAAREFERVTRLAPSWDEGYGWLSSALVEINQINAAISSLREAMRLAPKDARYPISLGHIFLRRHDYLKAIRMFRKGISLQPQSGAAEAHLFLAESHIGTGDTEEACRE